MKIALHLIFWAVVGSFVLSLNVHQSYSGEYTSLEDALKNPLEVLVLDLTRQDLTELPESIGDFENLKELRVGYNSLSKLPDGISRLFSLEVLKAGYNNLEALPPHIGNLKLLRELRVGYNNLSTLPTSIVDLISLERLHIGQNPLTQIPEGLANLSSLSHIGCNGTNIPRDDLRRLSRELSGVRVKF